MHLQALISVRFAAHHGIVLIIWSPVCACRWHATQQSGCFLHVLLVRCITKGSTVSDPDTCISAFPFWCLLLARHQNSALAAHRGLWCLCLALLVPAASLLALLLALAPPPLLWSVPAGNRNLSEESGRMCKQQCISCIEAIKYTGQRNGGPPLQNGPVSGAQQVWLP